MFNLNSLYQRIKNVVSVETNIVKHYSLRLFIVTYVVTAGGIILCSYFVISASETTNLVIRIFALILLFSGIIAIHIFWPRTGKSILNSQAKQQHDILDSMPDAMIIVNADGDILDWNLGAATLFGYGKHEVFGKPIFNLFSNAERKLYEKILILKQNNQAENLEIECIGKNEKRAQILFRQVAMNGHANESTQFIFWGRDITQYKQLQEQALQTEKMAATGRFAAEIAHQLNTPLASILLSAQMLQDAALKEDERDDIEKIIRQVIHGKIVVKSLLDFSKNAADETELVELNELIQNTVELFRRSLHERHIKIKCSYESRPCSRVAFKNEIEQVVLNLLTNAADAMPSGGTISVRTSLYLDRDFIIYFEDTGTGIPEKDRDNVFQPFFTTKEVGDGTGLGLPVCKRILEHHNGSIVLHSQEREGTMAVVKIPLYPLERKNASV